MKWFQHDGNARNDSKLKRLYRAYGSEGRDLYWQVVERIAEKLDAKHKTFTLEETSEELVIEMGGSEKGWDVAKVDAILKMCLDLELFDLCPSTNRIRCLKILSRLDVTTSRMAWVKELIATANRFTQEVSTSKLLRSRFEVTSNTKRRIEKIERIEKTLGRALTQLELVSVDDSPDEGAEAQAV